MYFFALRFIIPFWCKILTPFWGAEPRGPAAGTRWLQHSTAPAARRGGASAAMWAGTTRVNTRAKWSGTRAARVTRTLTAFAQVTTREQTSWDQINPIKMPFKLLKCSIYKLKPDPFFNAKEQFNKLRCLLSVCLFVCMSQKLKFIC